MINLSVIHVKDLAKYIIKWILMVGVIYIFISMFSNPSPEETQKVSRWIAQLDLKDCLKETIPMMGQVKQEDKDTVAQIEEDIEKIDPLKLVLGTQLEMMDTLVAKEKQKTEIKENVQKNVEIEQAKTGVSTEIVPSNVPTKFTNSYNGVQVKNETSYQLTEEMLKPDISINNKNVMIFHTHTCESYTPSDNYQYTQTGTYRTTDLNFSVARVGTELENQLKSYQYQVVHDKTYHDYPAYNGSYGRSLTTVENLLKTNPNTDMVFDVHRDAIGDYSYAPTVKIGEEYAAQIMFVIGTDGGGLAHPSWNQNLKFAVKIQEKANELYPGLFKPIILRNSRYNQHLAKAATIIEVGATGNTLDQCLVSMKYLAKVMSEVIK
ncbi:MAG: stage II sporulation protein P [Clostridia bacterium]